MSLAGAFGGLVTYLIIEPSASAREMGVRHSVAGDMAAAVGIGVTIGVMIGVSLIIVEEILSGSARRILTMLVKGAAAGILGGGIGTIIAQIVFSILLIPAVIGAMLSGTISKPLVMVARTIGWALMGAGAGICPGVATRSKLRVRQGLIGGLVGGALGGVLFDALAEPSHSGNVSRFVGFVSMGLFIGAAVSLIEEIAKRQWVTVLTGAREGRTYILSKEQTSIGRNELADIPLFGDSAVLGMHAMILSPSVAPTIAAALGTSVTINSQPASNAPLSNGDVIGIGRHRLRFSSSGGTRLNNAPMGAPQSVSTTPQWSNRTTGNLGSQASVPKYISVVSGPHMGESFSLTPDIILGRDPGCGVPLVRDGMISRQHAKLSWDGRTWWISDMGSTNGTYVRNVRVTREPVLPGEEIRVGQSVICLS